MQKIFRILIYFVALNAFACKTAKNTSDSGFRANNVQSSEVPLSDEPWRVYYQVYVRAFADGNDDDFAGDFDGLRSKLPYLKSLGIDALMLMPIFESTGWMGYVPRDYTKVDPQYGTIESFKALTEEAKRLNIRIMIDYVVNHISDDSPWFKAAVDKNCMQENKKHSGYCDYFYFVNDPCGKNTKPYSNWRTPWDPKTNCKNVWYQKYNLNPATDRTEHYFGTFSQGMPDLKFWDFDKGGFNEPVVNEIQKITKQWAQNGVDGFRIDAARHFVEGPETNGNSAEPNNIVFVKKLLESVRTVKPGTSFAGEIFEGDWKPIEMYVNTAMDMVFDFPFMFRMRRAARDGDGAPMNEVLKHFADGQNQIHHGQRIVFSTNHDVSRLMTEWASLPDREARVRLAQFVTLLSPSIPLIYYGEELGMEGEVIRPSAENGGLESITSVGTYPWTGDENRGWSGAPETDSNFHVAGDPRRKAKSEKFNQVNRGRSADAAMANKNSLWNYIKAITSIRKRLNISNKTVLALYDKTDAKVVGYTLMNDSDGKRTCRSIFVNFDAKSSQTRELKHAAGCESSPLDAVYSEGVTKNADGTVFKPFGKVIIGDRL